MNKIILTALIIAAAILGFIQLRKDNKQVPVIDDTQITATSTNTGGGQGIVAYKSGVNGTVMVGPTCPVMQNPPDPQCADKPLSTLVAIFRQSDPVHAYALFQSDKEGKFSASLPPGEYVVGAGENNLPRCPQMPVTVGPAGYASITISCDSGIR